MQSIQAKRRSKFNYFALRARFVLSETAETSTAPSAQTRVELRSFRPAGDTQATLLPHTTELEKCNKTLLMTDCILALLSLWLLLPTSRRSLRPGRSLALRVTVRELAGGRLRADLVDGEAVSTKHGQSEHRHQPGRHDRPRPDGAGPHHPAQQPRHPGPEVRGRPGLAGLQQLSCNTEYSGPLLYLPGPGSGQQSECEPGCQGGNRPLLDEPHGAAGRHQGSEPEPGVVGRHGDLCNGETSRRGLWRSDKTT